MSSPLENRFKEWSSKDLMAGSDDSEEAESESEEEDLGTVPPLSSSPPVHSGSSPSSDYSFESGEPLPSTSQALSLPTNLSSLESKLLCQLHSPVFDTKIIEEPENFGDQLKLLLEAVLRKRLGHHLDSQRTSAQSFRPITGPLCSHSYDPVLEMESRSPSAESLGCSPSILSRWFTESVSDEAASQRAAPVIRRYEIYCYRPTQGAEV